MEEVEGPSTGQRQQQPQQQGSQRWGLPATAAAAAETVPAAAAAAAVQSGGEMLLAVFEDRTGRPDAPGRLGQGSSAQQAQQAQQPEAQTARRQPIVFGAPGGAATGAVAAAAEAVEPALPTPPEAGGQEGPAFSALHHEIAEFAHRATPSAGEIAGACGRGFLFAIAGPTNTCRADSWGGLSYGARRQSLLELPFL